MGLITLTDSGNFRHIESFLNNAKRINYNRILNSYGQKGVDALAKATPKDSGTTASSWKYDIKTTPSQITLSWSNSNVNDGIPVAILLQYGHGTQGGGYVQGRDYINPALRELFDQLANDAWKEIQNL